MFNNDRIISIIVNALMWTGEDIFGDPKIGSLGSSWRVDK